MADVDLNLVDLFVGAFLGGFLPWLWTTTFRRWQLRLAGAVFPVTADRGRNPIMYIRASLDEIESGSAPPTLRGYTHSGDVLGVMNIVQHFDELPIATQFDYFPEIREYMRNVVILGISIRSPVSKEIAMRLQDSGVMIPVEAGHAYFKDDKGNEYRCQHIEPNGRRIVSKDVGIILRTETDNGAIVLLCSGVHTFGTQAAVEVALSPDFQRKVRRRRLRQFIQFVSVDVITSGERAGLGLVGQSIRWKDLPLQKLPALR